MHRACLPSIYMEGTASPGVRTTNAGKMRGGVLPPHAFFLISAAFHYLGPSFAVLLFSRVEVLGVVWLRIVSAAAVFAIWRRPWQVFSQVAPHHRATLVALGGVLAAMNACFYLAIDRVPLGTVGAIEFLGPIGLAALGVRRLRTLLALGLAVVGVYTLTDVRIAGQPIGFLFTFANSALFVLYIVLGHRLAQDGGASGIDRLGAAMLVAAAGVTPFTIGCAIPAFRDLTLLGAGIGVGICSSVIPYVCDQLAMSRLPRATFALLLALLPATATIVGVVILRQVPTAVELVGVLLVIAGVAVHREGPN